jgi:hypothetical protein
VSIVSEINVGFCFYDDPRYVTDADRDSYILQDWHRQLWSRDLPSGDRLQWVSERGEYLTCAGPYGPVRVSSDTIATTHSRFPVVQHSRLWTDLSREEQDRYERAFYTIGGFIIFPVHSDSLNQLRGWDSKIADRFDLTLECIRQHYLGAQGNPLSAGLKVDAEYFRLFGEGSSGFAAYVDFFHLQDLVRGNTIKWLDDFDGSEWNFGAPPLPQSSSAYRRYLHNVAAFVSARNRRIQGWLDARDNR